MLEHLSYYLLRTITYPFAYLPLKTLHFIGKKIGTIAYFLIPKFRKRTLSNLALAKSLNLNNAEIIHLSKASMQNLAIVLLEYAKLAKEDVIKIVECENKVLLEEFARKKQGVIFFCGHQSNWELLFLYGIRFMEGIAIGRPIKNSLLYNWIISIREKHGGKIITPKNALKEGLKGLKEGKFLGIVGDQGMPDSSYSYPFLGRKAWSSSGPAFLAYKANCPIIVASMHRSQGKYQLTYSDPIWPNTASPMQDEVKRIMDTTLATFEEVVKKHPDEWLWQHNRWKQQLPNILKKPFRQECLAIILPKEEPLLQQLIEQLPLFKEIYPREFITLFAPQEKAPLLPPLFEEIIPYSDEKELLRDDFRFKLVLNFTNCNQIKRHFLHLAAFHVFSLKDLKKISKVETNNLSQIIKSALLKGED